MKKIKVHIADDHQLLIDGVKAVLSSEDNIETVGFSLNGEDVITWFESNQADVLILDISMPIVDGIAVLQNFKKRKLNQKVIILSSYDDTKLIQEVLKIGASGFLAKKCAAENIVDAINVVYNGKQYFSESIQSKLLATFSSDYSNTGEYSEYSSFFSSLTPREVDVLQLIAQQFNTREIGEKLHISINTVETHRKKLISKLNVKNVAGLAVYAAKNNLV
ncbi:two component transcriptional regulator, LuxR family [Lutibacter oricola]|uniref:Two component transcriptional regulator, LuxR family n=1 Tax=Lutibacter oricola TaxID=762486 RepID=A0A1H2UE72_9FLAO|nr:response regulator transcription factor [Lutibacter oricola]SDW54317.1 two component transcriptional regulator, LuxR family [Lutibacter oricola]